MSFTFLTGAAGTGKTFTIKKQVQKDPMYAVITATTGIAAVNTGGITLNSLLGFYNYEDLYYKYKDKQITKRLQQIKERGYLGIVIDEASMLGNNTLDILYNCFEEINYHSAYEFNLTLVGDLLQLPPINEDYIIKAQSWEYFKIKLLTDIKRQTDIEFINCLNQIRLGNPEPAADYLAKQKIFHDYIDKNFLGTTLFSTNKEVDEYNKFRLDLLNTKERVYTNKIEGLASPDWKNIPKELTLKEGALVMLLANSYEQNDYIDYGKENNYFLNSSIRYANGDLGICRHLGKTGVIVELIRNKQQVFVQPIVRKYESFSKSRKKVLGRITYLPIKVAYGSTLHKSQGLTLDRVQIDINSNFLNKIQGALYVALSRVRTVNGLRIIGNPEQFKRRCIVNKNLVNFYKSLQDGSATVESSAESPC
jgi:ATP-dependent DNA helicase PIF1